jgi:hypothetical protein
MHGRLLVGRPGDLKPEAPSDALRPRRPLPPDAVTEQERAALEAVARRFSATWEQGGDPPAAYLTVDGKRIAIALATLKAGQGETAKIRLRFDKVVIRLMDRLQATLGEIVPDGTTVLLTITAPIRLASKTAAALEDKVQALLGWRSPVRDEEDTIHGNRVRIRLVRHGSERAPKLIGFVHNPDSDPLRLLDMTNELLDLLGAVPGRRAGDRWLVLTSAGGAAYLDAYRYIVSQLRTATDFTKILMVLGDGPIAVLTG